MLLSGTNRPDGISSQDDSCNTLHSNILNRFDPNNQNYVTS
uniref:Uncharacterized protein n=1 Tax=Rhizophora mucronata TaxID=61149 RepID=A0A2P2IUL3_RHIMU